DVAHKAEYEYREYQNGEIALERREVSQAHRAGDYELAAQHQNYEYRKVGSEGDDRNHCRKKLQDADSDIFCLRVRFGEFSMLCVLRIQYPYQGRAEDAFVYNLI